MMHKLFSTTEITSPHLNSDAPLHFRLLFAYEAAKAYIHGGQLLEIGCGIGRGIPILLQQAETYHGIDKNSRLIEQLRYQYPQAKFYVGHVPPLAAFSDNSFDYVVCFQVIEHVQDDQALLAELARILRPGGTLLLSTPNRLRSLTRNPWHVREYTARELEQLLARHFSSVRLQGIAGNQVVENYMQANAVAVARWKRLDPLDLEHKLPAWLLRLPYEVLNRINRKRLLQHTQAQHISSQDYYLSSDTSTALDCFAIARK